MKYECEKCDKIVDSERIVAVNPSGLKTMYYCFECYARFHAMQHGLIKKVFNEEKYKKIMRYLEGK